MQNVKKENVVFSKNLRKLTIKYCKKHGKTSNLDFAGFLDIDVKSFQNYLNGSQMPNIYKIAEMVKLFDTTYESLLFSE
jgi:hypothetical protein